MILFNTINNSNQTHTDLLIHQHVIVQCAEAGHWIQHPVLTPNGAF